MIMIADANTNYIEINTKIIINVSTDKATETLTVRITIRIIMMEEIVMITIWMMMIKENKK